VATGHRTAILITAAVVLFAGALFAVLYVVLLLPFASSERAPRSRAPSSDSCSCTAPCKPWRACSCCCCGRAGRWLGIVLAVVGIGLGIARASSTPASGLVTILLNAFVIYALASSGPAFRRG
jgi:hypothetical protein